MNLFEYYPGSTQEYFIFIQRFAEYFIDNGINCDQDPDDLEEKQLLVQFISNFSYFLKNFQESPYLTDIIYIRGPFASIRILRKELEFLQKYVISELYNYGIKISLYECDSIYFNTDLDSIYGDELDDNHINFILIRKKQSTLQLREIMKEIIRLRAMGMNDSIKMNITHKFNTKSLDFLVRDKRLYKDVIDIIKSYAWFDELNIEFNFT
jgi:hypothetical protein